VHFCNNILHCEPISIIDTPNCSAENWLEICDTFTYLTFRYSLKIVTSYPRLAHKTVELLKIETSDFIPPTLWPPNSPDLNAVDYKIWGLLQERVYETSIKDVVELRRRIAEEWDKLDHRIIDKAVAEWQERLRASVAAGGGQFEHKI